MSALLHGSSVVYSYFCVIVIVILRYGHVLSFWGNYGVIVTS